VRCTLTAMLALSLLAVGSAEAQKNCRKGIRCGNSCISATKVCRTGARPAPTSPTPTRTDSTTAAPNQHGAWVGSTHGHTYYRRGCGTANRLSPANVIYFNTEEEAQRAGYHRSTSRGC